MTTILMSCMTAARLFAVVVVAASFSDLSIGLLATLARDAVGAIRRLGTRRT
jgi:hypothetical protein